MNCSSNCKPHENGKRLAMGCSIFFGSFFSAILFLTWVLLTTHFESNSFLSTLHCRGDALLKGWAQSCDEAHLAPVVVNEDDNPDNKNLDEDKKQNKEQMQEEMKEEKQEEEEKKKEEKKEEEEKKKKKKKKEVKMLKRDIWRFFLSLSLCFIYTLVLKHVFIKYKK
eukprot:GHVL01020432.1.p1 GENE.GHVL01020432.1~~GHVL01020432.1.p1  ORF type:complete len:167 (+),score=44.52 GHVL01020432.1:141-641(+)